MHPSQSRSRKKSGSLLAPQLGVSKHFYGPTSLICKWESLLRGSVSSNRKAWMCQAQRRQQPSLPQWFLSPPTLTSYLRCPSSSVAFGGRGGAGRTGLWMLNAQLSETNGSPQSLQRRVSQKSSREQSGGMKKGSRGKKTSEQVSRDLILSTVNC